MTDPRRKASGAQERALAARIGAHQHRGSGSGRRRQDMHTEIDLIECKTVLDGNKQIVLKADDLRSLAYRAALEDRQPVLHVRLKAAAPFTRWVLISEDEYEERHAT
jgi:hypothetical protein